MKEIYYFTADWCSPCKKVKPIVEELNNESFNVKFKIINIDSDLQIAKNFGVSSIPTFILLKNNKEIKRISGAKTREQLEELRNYDE